MEQQRGQSEQRALVIVVDDNPAVRSSLKFSLEIEGFRVRTYARGHDLLNDADLQDCNCFVIDHNMPDMNGLDAIAALRRRHISTPAILITSYPTAALSDRAAGGGVPIVEKPLLGNTLLERIQDVIRLQSGSAGG